ncbi:DUF881 domain-containing protein [Pseudalkalibacillus caeni]|uniref:DUF881 domain-containing protein n=1 Tax=Exobacillus caeni TaxID=2574798 RepID=A0A5R9EW25_9BACL|nr:DUF881 domain-containing protein [Pseudalkalibacillus caeni]TLS35247.1 DUF881 domain-containing protein [Pseudalkalibacillus caeni]
MITRRKLVFTMVAFLVGFMIAIQFQTTRKPAARDTRDIWELREDIEKEKITQQELLYEIQSYESLLNEYVSKQDKERMKTMQLELKSLKKEAGLTKVSGQGIVMTIEPLFSEALLGEPIGYVTDDLLMRLLNEINLYDAEAISIADQRIVTNTAVREVNGKTYINNRPLPPLPVEINIISDDPEKMHAKMAASQAMDDFAKENLGLTLDPEIKDKLTLPAYEQHIPVKFMKKAGEDS